MIDYSLSQHTNPMDADATKKWYGVPQYTEVVDINAFAQHIVNHGSVYSRADVQAILILAVDCIKELCLDSKKVSLGDLGSFGVTFKSKGKINATDYDTSTCIKKVGIRFTPSKMLKNLKNEATYNLVPTRRVQAATLKQLSGGTGGVKTGKTTTTVTIQTVKGNS